MENNEVKLEEVTFENNEVKLEEVTFENNEVVDLEISTYSGWVCGKGCSDSGKLCGFTCK